MQELKPITIEDICAYRIPSALRYSPLGGSLAFEVKRADPEKNETRTDVWLCRDGQSRRVTWGADAGIALWLDEGTLVITRKCPDAPKNATPLFLLRTDGGEAEPWITLPFSLSEMRKTDFGFAAVGSIRTEDPDGYLDGAEARAEKEKAAEEEKDCEVLDEVPYWFNGSGFTNGRRQALFLVRAENGTARCRRVTDPYFSVDSFCTDGKRVYFSGSDFRGRMPLTNKVYACDAESGHIETVYAGNDRSSGGLFLLGGRLCAHSTDMKTYGCNETPDLCRFENGKCVPLHRPEYSLCSNLLGDTAEGGEGCAWDGTEYLTLATVHSRNAVLAFTETEGGLEQRTLWQGDGMACTLDACADRVAMVYQDRNRVAEVYEMDRDGKNLRPVTCLNKEALEGRYAALPQPLDFESCGLRLRGWVLLPRDYDGQRPCPGILDIHGGPRCTYGETFFHEMQVWAGHGYAVFFTNIKGSDGWGDAFADLRGDYGGTDYRNLMDFTDAVLRAYPAIDPRRLCVTGGSYGGFMTNWIIGHTDRFCCAASQRSISNWVSFAFTSDIGAFFAANENAVESPFGEENIRVLWEHSPLKYADRVRTPTLFIHSDEDYRCPLPEGMQMMQALAQRGVETRMCLFHGENHELSRSGRPRHRMRRLKEMTDWFDRHTGLK